MFISISHLAVKKVAFSSTLQLLQCIKVVLSLKKYIMILMHDKKFRKESDTKRKKEKKRKRKKEIAMDTQKTDWYKLVYASLEQKEKKINLHK